VIGGGERVESGGLGWGGVGGGGGKASAIVWKLAAMQPPEGMDHGRNKARRASSSAARVVRSSMVAAWRPTISHQSMVSAARCSAAVGSTSTTAPSTTSTVETRLPVR